MRLSRHLLALLFPLLLVPGLDTGIAQTPTQPRTFLVIVDDLHLDFGQTPRLRSLTSQLLRSLVRNGARFGMVSTGPSGLSVAPTLESAPLESAVSRIVGSALRPAAFLGAPRWPSAAEVEVRHRAETAFATASKAIDAIAAGQAAPSFNILYVSSGYDLGRVPEPNSLIQAAFRAGAAINTIDPRGFDDIAVPQGVSEAEWAAYLMATKDSLNAIATQTKGMAVFTPSDLATLQASLVNTAR